MPTYEYRCKRCKHHFEKLQPITANALRTCPSCGKKTLERVIGVGGGILVAGSGGGHGDRDEAAAQTSGAASAKDTKSADSKQGATARGGDGAKSGAAGSATNAPANGKTKSGAAGAADKGASAGSDASKGATSDSSGSAAADPDRAAWKSKATHSSREGRGLGNLGSILKGAPTRGPKSGAPGQGGRGTSPGRNAPRRRSP